MYVLCEFRSAFSRRWKREKTHSCILQSILLRIPPKMKNTQPFVTPESRNCKEKIAPWKADSRLPTLKLLDFKNLLTRLRESHSPTDWSHLLIVSLLNFPIIKSSRM